VVVNKGMEVEAKAHYTKDVGGGRERERERERRPCSNPLLRFSHDSEKLPPVFYLWFILY
jgi:hypothetical protein